MPSTSVPASQPTSLLVRSGALEHRKTIARILEVNALSFAYPSDRLLMFKGTIPDEDICRSRSGPCLITLMVIKRGNLTVGRANDICSYARNYYDGDKAQAPKEWATLRSTPTSSPVDHRWHHDFLGLHLRHAHQLLPQAHTRPLSCPHCLDAFARSSQCRQSVLCAVAQPVLLFSAATDDCSIPASPIFALPGPIPPNRVALRYRHRDTFLISYPTSKGRLGCS
ncbi:hypothetical protein BGY98DRAFT_1184544 [Russula aff. rugulosa BPL654]|nr:hypothetical protein BGY98DRAFT_1184544 [Russula aff. rugulosa BPL654]